ncbi:hypothetical protein WMY93_010786 [Mugilogobius chulae]|uniref:Nuclear receptor-binding factor 2 n=1 Tax=Mugilogobius chulae TaxID=88201 RepID=A0AAW0PH88_9GOBI
MTVRDGQRHLSCSVIRRRLGSMEVADSPLNLAHQQCRKAERLLSAGKYEEAILCHRKAADLLSDAMKNTQVEQARLSMELQRDAHIKQQRLIQERWKRETRRQATKARTIPSVSLPQSADPLQCPGMVAHERSRDREYDTLLYQLQTRQSGGPPVPQPCPGLKTTKDDKTRLEEQQTTIEDLRRLVEHLMDENLRLTTENDRLKIENARLQSEATDFVERSELWVLPQSAGAMGTGVGHEKRVKGKEIAIPTLPPLEMPAQEDLCLDDLPPLELPEDIQNELRELLEADKL